jgi:hypothetical protein
VHGTAEAVSHMVLPHATAVCVNSSLVWTFDGVVMHGEDQDVWPIPAWQKLRAERRRR